MTFNIDINEKALTFSSKTVNLDTVIKGYRELNLPDTNSYFAHVPHIVIRTMDRLIQLKEQGICKTTEILNAFLNCDKDGSTWNSLDEDKLTEYKLEINKRKDPIKDITEPRFLTQLLLDFFSSLSQPMIVGSFKQQWKDMLGDGDLMRKFVNSDSPQLKDLKENIYHTLEFIAKTMNNLVGKNSDSQRLSTLRLVLLRLSLSLTQADKPHFFFSRNILMHKDYIEQASSDSITELLYMWTTEHSPGARDVYRGLFSPLPNLHSKIMQRHGSSTPNNPDKFQSRTLSSSFVKQQRHHQRTYGGGAGDPVISEEDDGANSVLTDQNLDEFPDEIKNFMPVFMDMPYDEQNAIMKELNAILLQSSDI